MKIYRFMNLEELKKVTSGENVTNNTKHQGNTNSEGFCFMSIEDECPEQAFEYLSGIVSEDVCVVFETNKELKKTWGIYADPYGYFFDAITRNEYCINTYNNKDFKILRMAEPRHSESWKWEKDIDSFLLKAQERKNKLIEKQREKEEICKCEATFGIKKREELVRFCEEISRGGNRCLEFKINNKFYKVKSNIEEICTDSSGRTYMKLYIGF